MRSTELTKHVGKVVLMDLVTGMQICTEIKIVNEMTSQVETGKVIVFQISVEPQDPTQPPSPHNPVVQKVNAQPYGGPFTIHKPDGEFDSKHIVAVHVPIEAIEKAYLQAVSGIEVVGAGAIQNIKGGPSGIVS